MIRGVDSIEIVEIDISHEWIVVRMVFPYLTVLDGIQSSSNQLLDSSLKDGVHRGSLLFSLMLDSCRDIEALLFAIVLLFKRFVTNLVVWLQKYLNRSSIGCLDPVLLPIDIIKWGASFRWSFGPNSAWGNIETTTVENTQPT